MEDGQTYWLDHAVATVEEFLAEAADPHAAAWGACAIAGGQPAERRIQRG